MSPTKPSVNAGLRILIAGATDVPDATPSVAVRTPAAGETETKSPPRELRFSALTQVFAVGGLATADLALLGWTTHYVITHKHILSLWSAAGCTVSVLVAALCGTAALSLVASPKK